jgi:predicted transcriptional regulator YheO
MSEEEKRRLPVSNIYSHNAFMMLNKEHEAERLAKVYKETNKEREEWRTSIQRQRDNKQKRTAVVIIQKYTCKWMGRHTYLKLLLATTFTQCCYRQLRARKLLERLKQEAMELSIKPVSDSRMNHLEERGNDTVQVRSQIQILE